MKYIMQLLFFLVGLIIFSYGITVSIQVQHLGIQPWDVLNIALNEKYGLTIGSWNLICGLILIRSFKGLIPRSMLRQQTMFEL